MLWREGDPGTRRVWRGREREAGGMGEGRGRPEAYGKELWCQEGGGGMGGELPCSRQTLGPPPVPPPLIFTPSLPGVGGGLVSQIRLRSLKQLSQNLTAGEWRLCVDPGLLDLESSFLSFHLVPAGAVIKNPPAKAGDVRDSFDPWLGKIRWRRKWQPTPVFLPGEAHGQRRLVGYIQSIGSQRVGHD